MKKIEWKIVKFSGYSEYYLTLDLLGVSWNRVSDLVKKIKKEDLKILKVTLCGNADRVKEYGAIFKGYPQIAISNSNRTEKDITSLCIIAVRGEFDRFEYIRREDEVIGAYYKKSKREYLSLSGLRANNLYQKKDFRSEAKETYRIAKEIFSLYNFSVRDVYYFLNLIVNISEHYAAFNQARDAYFKKNNVTDYPAATGVETTLPGKQRFSLSLEAMKAEKRNGVSSKTLHSDFQCEAWEYQKLGVRSYGPKFSRGKILSFAKDNIEKIYISGTSSVDQKGKSILLDDCGKNVEYVMSCAEHLLQKSGVELENIVISNIYFKNGEVADFFRRLYEKNQWSFPYCPVFVEICRPNFVFEIACVAVKNKLAKK